MADVCDQQFLFKQGQSPVNIDTMTVQSYPTDFPITLHYADSTSYVRDSGFNLEVGLSGSATFGSQQTTLQQCHFHTPSEHRHNNESFVAECHFVHQDDHGHYFVIAQLLTIGPENELLAQASRAHHGRLDFKSLQDALSDIYIYSGSLTTPPFVERVTWVVLRAMGTLSEEQLNYLNGYYTSNNRPVQPLADRTIFVK
jgi:carbonic anhydrase